MWVGTEEGKSDLGDLSDLGVEGYICSFMHSFTCDTGLRIFYMSGIVLRSGSTVRNQTCSLASQDFDPGLQTIKCQAEVNTEQNGNTYVEPL